MWMWMPIAVSSFEEQDGLHRENQVEWWSRMKVEMNDPAQRSARGAAGDDGLHATTATSPRGSNSRFPCRHPLILPPSPSSSQLETP